MCNLTTECFKYLAQQKFQDRKLSHSEKLNLFAIENGYKNYNAALKAISLNIPAFDIRLLFPDTKESNDLEEMKKEVIYQLPNRYFSVTIENENFDEVIDFQFTETDNFIFGEKFHTEEQAFSAKSINFFIPSNMIATFSSQTFTHSCAFDDIEEIEQIVFIESSLNKMAVNADDCFVIGASAKTAEVLCYQYEKSITKIKDVEDSNLMNFFVLNNINFIDNKKKEYLKESFEVVIHAFIHLYMRYDYYTSSSFIIEIPFSTKNMTAEQFHLVQYLSETIISTCDDWKNVFTKPVHLYYTEYDKNRSYSYLFFTRKDIKGEISHNFRDNIRTFLDFDDSDEEID